MNKTIEKRLARLEAALEPDASKPIIIVAGDEIEVAAELARIEADGVDLAQRQVVVIRSGVPRAERGLAS